jgi:serine/threonine protein phosphatase PrpC
VYGDLDAEFLKLAYENNYPDGTTCLMALIMNNKLTVGNLGDSSAIMIRNNQMLELTSEQTPARIDEY